MTLQNRIAKQRTRRCFRVRNRVRRTDRPRLSVFRSNKHIYAQVIDDVAGHTLASASTRETGSSLKEAGGNCDAAVKIGTLIAERALERGVKQVAFDRGPYRFHGRVKALADAAREAGLDF